jgi:undecaprenyl diphosphate synthase
MQKVLEVCYKCGVKVVTVYAFSLENFHRPKYEVDGLMQLAKLKLEQIIQHGELLDRYGASVKVLGRLDLIPPDVLEVVERAVATTQHNTEYVASLQVVTSTHADNPLFQLCSQHLLPLHIERRDDHSDPNHRGGVLDHAAAPQHSLCSEQDNAEDYV